METKSCAFFGHRCFNVEPYRERLLQILTDLIENKGVTQFYTGCRGDFDRYCCGLIEELKVTYPHIKLTEVVSYMPYSDDPDCVYRLSDCFDGSVYLLEKWVPKRYAIIETNKKLASIVDYVVAGVKSHGGGAYAAVAYAHKKKKTIISIIDGWEVD